MSLSRRPCVVGPRSGALAWRGAAVLCTRIKVSEERCLRGASDSSRGFEAIYQDPGSGYCVYVFFRLRFILQPLHICLPGVSGVEREREFLDAVGL
jgi:hypothetical protein